MNTFEHVEPSGESAGTQIVDTTDHEALVWRASLDLMQRLCSQMAGLLQVRDALQDAGLPELAAIADKSIAALVDAQGDAVSMLTLLHNDTMGRA